MSQAPAQDSEKQQRVAVAQASRWRKLLRGYRTIPRWWRIGTITLLLVAALATVYALAPTEQARLQLICQHSFRSAQLSVLVDGSLAYSDTLAANSKKRLAIISKGSAGTENFSKVLNVTPGRHVVQVHISAPAEGFDQSRTVATNLSAEKESILTITATRRNTLAVNYEGATVTSAAVADEPHGTPRNGLTIVFSILGTMLSASISFLVQEFWRSHKNRAAQ